MCFCGLLIFSGLGVGCFGGALGHLDFLPIVSGFGSSLEELVLKAGHIFLKLGPEGGVEAVNQIGAQEVDCLHAGRAGVRVGTAQHLVDRRPLLRLSEHVHQRVKQLLGQVETLFEDNLLELVGHVEAGLLGLLRVEHHEGPAEFFSDHLVDGVLCLTEHFVEPLLVLI